VVKKRFNHSDVNPRAFRVFDPFANDSRGRDVIRQIGSLEDRVSTIESEVPHHLTGRARGSSLGRFGTFLLAWRVDARVTDERGGQSFGLLQDKHTCRIFAMAIIARP
jgi:hypothetical protein